MTQQPPSAAQIVDLLPDPTVVLDALGTVLWSNPAAATFTGLDPVVWTGRSVFELLHPDDHATALSAFETVSTKGVGNLIDVRIRDASNQWRSCEIRGRHVDGTDGQDAYIIIVIRDTSDRQMLELGRGDSEYLRAIVHHATALLATLSSKGTIVTANAELDRLLGHDLDVIGGLEFCDLLVADDRALFRGTLATIDGSSRVEVRAEGREGDIVHLDVWITDLRADALVEGYTLSATDITDLKKTQRALRHMANHDALTGLLSRRSLLAQLDNFVDDCYQHEIVILFCDLDGFKQINDRIGHGAGDQVLVEVARRLERSIRHGDLVGRLGGDEFVVVLPRADAETADAVAAEIRQALTEPIFAADQLLELDVSIGSATTGDSPTAARLLATADDAMYAVKSSRQHRVGSGRLPSNS